MDELTESNRSWLLRQARESISRHLRSLGPPEDQPPEEKLSEKSGVFVTLHMDGKLRGCIGMPLPELPLYIGVRENAVAAAFHDPRFPPVGVEELPRIHVEISVMTIPREIDNPEDVMVGRDGIIVSRGFQRGLLLPQVPVEQGWDRDRFLSYGCLKAGLPADAWRQGVRIEVFQALVFSEERAERI